MSPGSEPADEAVTHILEAIERGEPKAADQLLPLVYEELRRQAGAYMARQRPGQTVQATALVHEAYLRLVRRDDPGWNGRAHFYGAAARAMREILIEQARRKAALRHGGHVGRVDYDVAELSSDGQDVDVLALDEALGRLERQDPRVAEVVTLRFFGGLSLPDVAEVLGVSGSTVDRDWRYARTFLRAELRRGEEVGNSGESGET